MLIPSRNFRNARIPAPARLRGLATSIGIERYIVETGPAKILGWAGTCRLSPR
jgi:hypothetical protein